MEAIVCTQF